jgi:hypothetical protein
MAGLKAVANYCQKTVVQLLELLRNEKGVEPRIRPGFFNKVN